MMQQKAMSLIKWQEAFSTEEKCLEHLAQLRWPQGFICPKCNACEAWFTPGYNLYECKQCRKRTSITAGTLFHSTKIPLVKWFTALYFVGVDKGGISAERLRLYIDVSWKTADLMLSKLRLAMAERDKHYLLSGVIELDEAFIGGKTTGGKRGRGSDKKTAILVACEDIPGEGRAGYLKMKAVPSVSIKETHCFVREGIEPNQYLKMDGSNILQTLQSSHSVDSRALPACEANVWLPWVHIAIANLKRFLLGTFHGVSGKKLQGYLDEFCYRFNRRAWLLQIPNRLLLSAIHLKPIRRLAF